MPKLDELIDGLRAEGELDSVGEFTLDRERAREKMRRFQLADPRSYVLELVQTAVLAGATEARFEIDTDDMVLEFDGREFAAEDFEGLYTALFSRDDSPEARALRQLALGLNAAMALDPRHVRVESGGVSLEMRADGDEVESCQEPRGGTRIHVKDRFGARTLVRFYRKVRGTLAEVVCLEERCRHATLPIYVGGELTSGQPFLPDVLGRVEVRQPPVRIVAGFAGLRSQPAELRLYQEGVWITTHRLTEFPPDFVACAESAELEKDASLRDVVRGKAYIRLRAAVRETFYPALRRLAATALAEDETEDETENLFRQALFHPLAFPLVWGLLEETEPPEVPLDLAREIAAVPLWRSARGRGEALSLLDLLRLREQHGRVSWSSRRCPELPQGDRPPVAVVANWRDRAYLMKIFGDDLHAAEADLRKEQTRAHNRARWQLRRMEPRIPEPRALMILVPLRSEEVTGEVGVHLDPFNYMETYRSLSLWLIKEGRLLEKRTARHLVPGLAAVVEADFRPSELFDGVAVDRRYVRVALAVARTLGQLMDELAVTLAEQPVIDMRRAGLGRRCLIPYLGIDWRGDGLRQFLECFGITSEAHLAYAEECLAGEPLPVLAEADLEAAEPPALARLPLFDILGGKAVSLCEVAALRRTEGRLHYLPKSGVVEGTSASKTLLVLDDAELGTLRQVFGTRELKDYSRSYVYELAAARHLEKPVVPLYDPGVVNAELETGDGIRGRIGILRPKPADVPVTARLRLLKHDRHLDEIEYEVPVGPIAGVIADDRLRPTQDWSRARKGKRLDRLRRLASEEAAKLLVSLCEEISAAPADVRALLLSAMTRLLSTKDEPAEEWAGLASALTGAPLFADLRGEPLDLGTIRETVQKKGTVDYRLVDRSAGAASLREDADLAGDRRVVRLSPEDHAALTAVLGSGVLEDAGGWLDSRRKAREIAAAEPLERIELSPGEALVKVSLCSGGTIDGEVGLGKGPGYPELRLHLYKGGRFYTTWDTEAPLALVARVDDEELPLDEHGLVDLAGRRPDELRELCLGHVPALVREAALGFEQWPAAERAVAWQHLVDYLILESSREGRRPRESREVWETVCRLALFTGVDRRYSFTELSEACSVFGKQAYLTRPEGRSGDPPDEGEPDGLGRPVLLARPGEIESLPLLFPELDCWDGRWEKERAVLRRLASAPTLPDGPPATALVSRRGAGRGGLDTHLWLPGEPDAEFFVHFGYGGRQLGRVLVSEVFPCCGVVTGEGLLRRAPTEHQRVGLEKLSFRLYRQLAKDLFEPSRGRELRGARAEAAHRLLAHVRGALLCEKSARGPEPERLEFFDYLDRTLVPPPAPQDDDSQPPDPPAEDVLPAKSRQESGPPVGETRLLEALRAELRRACKQNARLLGDLNLDRIGLKDLDGEAMARCGNFGVTIDRSQPLVRELLAAPDPDPVLVAFLASVVYTALNHFWQEIEDDHEREFHGELMAALAARGPA